MHGLWISNSILIIGLGYSNVEKGSASRANSSPVANHPSPIRMVITLLSNNLLPVPLNSLCTYCIFPVLYVGHTTRTLRKRIAEHQRFIKKDCDKHSMPQHFLSHHIKNIKCLKVMAIEYISDRTLTVN